MGPLSSSQIHRGITVQINTHIKGNGGVIWAKRRIDKSNGLLYLG